MYFFLETYGECTAAALGLADGGEGEAVELLVDVEATAEKYLPTVVKENPSVMVSLEVPCELYTNGGKLVLQALEVIDDFGNLVIRVLSTQVNLQLFRVVAALTDGLYQFDEVVYLERCTDIRVNDGYVVSSAQVVAKEILVGHALLV